MTDIWQRAAHWANGIYIDKSIQVLINTIHNIAILIYNIQRYNIRILLSRKIS